MRIIQIVENANSAAQLKTAFDRDQWTKIILNFAALPGARNIGNNNIAIQNSLQNAFREIGPEMDDATTPEDWNAKAVPYGASLSNPSAATWPAIYAHLARFAGEDIEIPNRFSMYNPTPAGLSDTDRTPESRDEVAGWVQAPEQMNLEQLNQYFLDWIAALETKRSPEWMGVLSNGTGSVRVRVFRAMKNELRQQITEQNPSIAKTDVDNRLYNWLTSTDYQIVRAN